MLSTIVLAHYKLASLSSPIRSVFQHVPSAAQLCVDDSVMGDVIEMIVVGDVRRSLRKFVPDVLLSALWDEGARVHIHEKRRSR